MEGDNPNSGYDEARKMLETFASVGAVQFDVTGTDRAGEKKWFRRSVTAADLSKRLPAMLDATTRDQINLIVRPYGPTVSFIQLDDLKIEALSPLAPAVFLMLQTSPGNFQAWAAIDGSEDKDFARRLRKGTGADPTASGATRVAGSLNFKDKYAPDFPRVAIHHANPGRVTTTAELEKLGLVAERETESTPSTPARERPGPGKRRWPSYTRCLDGAPLNSEETGPDISRADFVFCMTAITWGWSKDETAARLMEESAKAQENGERYAQLTAQNAALAVERRRQQPGRGPRTGLTAA